MQGLKPGDLVLIDEDRPEARWIARLDTRDPALLYWGVTCVQGASNGWITPGRTTIMFDLSITKRGRVLSSFKQQLKELL